MGPERTQLKCGAKPTDGATLSPPQRLKGFFFRWKGFSSGTGLPATAESAGASARYHAQDGRGRQFSVGYSQGWLVYLVSVKMACKILRLSDVEGLA